MYPILFSVNGLNFYSYGLMITFAFLATTMVTTYFAKKEKIFSANLFDNMLILLLSGMAGARLIFFILYSGTFDHWYEIFFIWKGGMVSFGGILGAIVFMIIKFKKNFYKWADIISIGFLLGVFFWRIGCFLAGDHPEVTSNSIFAIRGVFPAVLYESLLGLFGFIIFSLLYKKLKSNIGYTFYLVIAYYGLIRIFTDHYRIDTITLGLKAGQLTGIILALIGIIGIIVLKSRRKNVKKNIR